MNVIQRVKLRQWSVLLIQIRGSQYNPHYIEPVFKPDEVDQLIKDGKAKEIAFAPIKAATSEQNTSVFRDDMIVKFTNIVMRNGRKELARNLIEKAFENIKCYQIEKYHKSEPGEQRDRIELNPVTIFHKALANCKPLLMLTPVKRGAIVYQVPVPITDYYSRFMAMRWIIEAAKDKDRKVHFPEKLAWELLDASKNEGKAVKRKQELHKQCEANKAYAHYRWGA